MTIDSNNPRHLIADESKVLKQISSGYILGSEVWLGPNDSVDNFEEVDEPKVENN